MNYAVKLYEYSHHLNPNEFEVGVSNVSNISERLTLMELTRCCAQSTHPAIPLVLPLGLLVVALKPLCFTSKRGLAVLEGLNIYVAKQQFLPQPYMFSFQGALTTLRKSKYKKA